MKYLKKEDNIPGDYVFLNNNFYYKKKLFNSKIQSKSRMFIH